MPQTLRVVWIGSAALTLAALGLAPALGRAQEPAAAAAAAPAAPGTPFDHGKAADGQTKAALCAACHGPGGNSTNPEWPRLAGQSAIYIAAQLHMFKAGTRVNPVMQPLVASLTDQDIDDLAVYFQSQTPLGLEADPSYWKSGEALYLRGDKDTGVPGCVACHGPAGRGNLAAGYPALRAQQSVYVVKQLNAYADGTRYTGAAAQKQDPNSVMMFTLAKRLTPAQIRDVASYVQGMR
jgi:cytochrome c553